MSTPIPAELDTDVFWWRWGFLSGLERVRVRKVTPKMVYSVEKWGGTYRLRKRTRDDLYERREDAIAARYSRMQEDLTDAIDKVETARDRLLAFMREHNLGGPT